MATVHSKRKIKPIDQKIKIMVIKGVGVLGCTDWLILNQVLMSTMAFFCLVS